MEKTSNYDIFKKHPNNRDIDAGNLERIKKSIQVSNLLEFRPILVDEQMRVIDGQHRLEAAKALGLPVCYVINKSTAVIDMALLNTNQKIWKLEDYLNYYVKTENPEYINFKSFIDRCDVDIRTALSVLGTRTHNESAVFREGGYKFPDKESVEKAKQLIQRVNETMVFILSKFLENKRFLCSVRFLDAFYSLFTHPEFDYELFRKKLEIRVGILRPALSRTHYTLMLKEIYNYRNSNPISVFG